MLEVLDGEGSAEVRRETLAHAACCPSCEAEYRAFERLTRRLKALGAFLHAQVPVIALRCAVMAALPAHSEETRDKNAALENALSELGGALASQSPKIDILSGVMASVAMMRAQEEANPGLTLELQMDFQSFMDDGLDAAGQARIDAAAEDYPAVRREFDALKTLREDLLAIGERYTAHVPVIDLLGAGVEDGGRPNLILAKTRAARERRLKRAAAPRASSWLSLAAAACLLLGLWAAADRWLLPEPAPPERVTVNTPDTPRIDGIPPIPPEENAVPPGPRETVPRVEPVPLPLLLATETVGSAPETPEVEDVSGFGIEDVLDARREAVLDDSDASTRLALWASLAPEQARKIVEDSGATVEELLGAAGYLGTEEARPFLEAAVNEYPDSADLRAALAENYATDPALADASLGQLAEWSALDPGNGLPLFMEANLLFEQGYSAAALESLDLAATQDSSSAYGLAGINDHAAALIAAGLDSDLAGLLAASAAGLDQYAGVTALSQQLLAQGQEYEAAGDFETAQQIYEAVRQLGVQIENGAVFTNEHLAGLTTQQQALDAYGALANLTPEEFGAWIEAMVALGDSINTLLPLSNMIDRAYEVLDLSSVGGFVDHIQNNGDIGLAQQILDATETLAEDLTLRLLNSLF